MKFKKNQKIVAIIVKKRYGLYEGEFVEYVSNNPEKCIIWIGNYNNDQAFEVDVKYVMPHNVTDSKTYKKYEEIKNEETESLALFIMNTMHEMSFTDVKITLTEFAKRIAAIDANASYFKGLATVDIKPTKYYKHMKNTFK